MSQKAEVKVVVNTAEARAALLRLEEEALRVEAEVNRTGKKAKAGNYKSAKNAAESGQAEHRASTEGASGHGVSSGHTVAAAAGAATIAGRLDRTKLNSKGEIKNFITADPTQKGFNRSNYKTSFLSHLTHVEKVPTNLAKAVAAAQTDFFVMEGLDRDRLMSASMKVAKSRMYSLYGWWIGKDPKEKWMNIYKNDVGEQIRKNYNAMESEARIAAPTPIKGKRFSLMQRFKNAGQSVLSMGLGATGVRGVMGRVFGIAMAGMLIQQIGHSSVTRLNAMSQGAATSLGGFVGGWAGWGGDIVSRVSSGVANFGVQTFYGAANIFMEISALAGSFFGLQSKDYSSIRDLAASNNAERKKWSEWAGEEGVLNPMFNNSMTEPAKRLGDYLTAAGRWGTERENRTFALQALETAEKMAKKRAELGSQG